jgi:hypothetical protein
LFLFIQNDLSHKDLSMAAILYVASLIVLVLIFGRAALKPVA